MVTMIIAITTNTTTLSTTTSIQLTGTLGGREARVPVFRPRPGEPLIVVGTTEIDHPGLLVRSLEFTTTTTSSSSRLVALNVAGQMCLGIVRFIGDRSRKVPGQN